MHFFIYFTADDCFPTPPTSPATPTSRNLHFEALFNDVADESRTKVFAFS
jgi:hypothetical protein